MPRKKQTFLLVSLQEDQAKKLAQVVSNNTCRKILEYLGEHEATESELAKKLNLPISTVHYNLQALQKGNLVEAEEFHYSEKGKEVLHYRLANKYIIIAPKSTFGLKEKLRSILPVGAITLGAAGILQIFRKYLPGGARETLFAQAPKAAMDTSSYAGAEIAKAAAPLAEEGAREAAEQAIEVVADETASTIAEQAVETAAIAGNDAANEIVTHTFDLAGDGTLQSVQVMASEPSWIASLMASPAFWFLVGAFTALGLYLLFMYFRMRKK